MTLHADTTLLLDAVPWQPVAREGAPPTDVAYATHTGVLTIDGLHLDVVQLNTGQRVVTEESLVRLLEWLEGQSA